jgi:hypothetical protein
LVCLAVVVFAAMYLLVLTPPAVLLRLLPTPRRDSYWQSRVQCDDLASYLRAF